MSLLFLLTPILCVWPQAEWMKHWIFQDCVIYIMGVVILLNFPHVIRYFYMRKLTWENLPEAQGTSFVLIVTMCFPVILAAALHLEQEKLSLQGWNMILLLGSFWGFVSLILTIANRVGMLVLWCVNRFDIRTPRILSEEATHGTYGMHELALDTL